MSLIDKAIFEGRGARGSSDSDYAFAMTTCCERVGVVDCELDEFYWNPDTPSTSISFLDHPACPYCGASRFGLYPIDRLEQVPEHWRWACADAPRPGSRRVRPLAEHVRELLAVCERRAGPLPAYGKMLFFETLEGAGAGLAQLTRDALLTAPEFAPRFDRLLVSGYAWVNLCACGIWEDALIVRVERPRDPTGVAVGLTQVSYTGPLRGPDGSHQWVLKR